MNNDAIIIGYSGHAFVVIDVLRSAGFNCHSYCEKNYKTDNPFCLKFIGSEWDISVLEKLKLNNVFLGIGDNYLRTKVYNHLQSKNISTPSVSHPSAIISPLVQLGEGSVIMPGVIINALCNIGKGVICNSGSIIEHECQLGDFVHVAPGAVLSGNVSVGKHSFIGANSVVKQGVTIGERVVIGAGSVVLNNVVNDSILYGNPAKNK